MTTNKDFKKEYKELPSEVKSFDDKEMTIEHFISTETQDSGGDIMLAEGMILRGKVVVLFQHGQDVKFGAEPIAKVLSLTVGTFDGKKGIIAKTKYFDGSKMTPPDNTGERLYLKAKDGTMPNWSIGFNVLESTPSDNGGRIVSKWELLEYSQVNIGMNKEATTIDKVNENIECKFLIELEQKDIPATEIKAVIPYKEHSCDKEDTTWDAAAEVKAASIDDLKIMCAWFEEKNKDNKSAYKFPHHTASGYHTNFKACSAGIAALNGARGGASIPEGDRHGVYQHLAKHIKDDFKRDAPELKDEVEESGKTMKTTEAKDLSAYAEVKSISENMSAQIPYSNMCNTTEQIRYALLNEVVNKCYDSKDDEDMVEKCKEIMDDYIAAFVKYVAPHATQYMQAVQNSIHGKTDPEKIEQKALFLKSIVKVDTAILTEQKDVAQVKPPETIVPIAQKSEPVQTEKKYRIVTPQVKTFKITRDSLQNLKTIADKMANEAIRDVKNKLGR